MKIMMANIQIFLLLQMHLITSIFSTKSDELSTNLNNDPRHSLPIGSNPSDPTYTLNPDRGNPTLNEENQIQHSSHSQPSSSNPHLQSSSSQNYGQLNSPSPFTFEELGFSSGIDWPSLDPMQIEQHQSTQNPPNQPNAAPLSPFGSQFRQVPRQTPRPSHQTALKNFPFLLTDANPPQLGSSTSGHHAQSGLNLGNFSLGNIPHTANFGQFGSRPIYPRHNAVGLPPMNPQLIQPLSYAASLHDSQFRPMNQADPSAGNQAQQNRPHWLPRTSQITRQTGITSPLHSSSMSNPPFRQPYPQFSNTSHKLGSINNSRQQRPTPAGQSKRQQHSRPQLPNRRGKNTPKSVPSTVSNLVPRPTNTVRNTQDPVTENPVPSPSKAVPDPRPHNSRSSNQGPASPSSGHNLSHQPEQGAEAASQPISHIQLVLPAVNSPMPVRDPHGKRKANELRDINERADKTPRVSPQMGPQQHADEGHQQQRHPLQQQMASSSLGENQVEPSFSLDEGKELLEALYMVQKYTNYSKKHREDITEYLEIHVQDYFDSEFFLGISSINDEWEIKMDKELLKNDEAETERKKVVERIGHFKVVKNDGTILEPKSTAELLENLPFNQSYGDLLEYYDNIGERLAASGLAAHIDAKCNNIILDWRQQDVGGIVREQIYWGDHALCIMAHLFAFGVSVYERIIEQIEENAKTIDQISDPKFMEKSRIDIYGVWLCDSAIDIFNFLGPHNENVFMGKTPTRGEGNAKSPEKESAKSLAGDGKSVKSPTQEEINLNEVNVESREPYPYPHTSGGNFATSNTAEGLSIEEKERIMIARIGDKYLKKYFNERDFLMWF